MGVAGAVLALSAWGALNLFKFKPSGTGGLIKWGSLGLAFSLGIGAVGWGFVYQKPTQSKTVQFGYTGGVQTWTVPAGVTSATFTVIGAPGGLGCGTAGGQTPVPDKPGGNGGEAIATMTVTPGQVFQIRVGGKGKNGFCSDLKNHAAGGFNGGGAGGASATLFAAGGGGGASDVRHAPYGLVARDVVGGGGGGGGGWFGGQGGAGGGLNGANGGPEVDGRQGGGGTQVSGGSGGIHGGGCGGAGEGGTFGLGGNGGSYTQPQGAAGGGGGGGWNGGGGGGCSVIDFGGGGGGGSSHGPNGTVYIPGANNSSHGSVTITYLGF